MDLSGVLNIILPIVFILVGVALIVFVVELIKTVRSARVVIEDAKAQIDPTLANVEQITAKVDPLVDRVQLTVDAANLEMMRIDQILEDVSEITDTASSATAAVDNITNAPIKAVSNVATRVREAFGGKDASDESAQLAEQRVAVAQALEDYKAAEEKDARKADRAPQDEVGDASDAVANDADGYVAVLDGSSDPSGSDGVSEDGSVPAFSSEPVIDPKVLEESSFFDQKPDAE